MKTREQELLVGFNSELAVVHHDPAPPTESTSPATPTGATKSDGDRPAAPPKTRPARPGLRKDIQALRAIAVLVVVIFHVQPDRLPGGFLGVDMFFTISGFLITQHLVSRLEAGRFSFGEFYFRRVRRLLPAAALVIVTTMFAVLFSMPPSRWFEASAQAVASAFYVQNWWLNWGSTDYFAATGVFQHYWSLSVEEQFYLLWPVLLWGSFLATKRLRLTWSSRRTAIVVIGLAVLLSLIASIGLSHSDPQSAYLVTYTRVWQFGLGALIGLLPSYVGKRQQLLGLIGFVALPIVLGGAFLMLSEQDPVPGWVTSVPLAVVAWVLAFKIPDHLPVLRQLITNRPVQFLGDVSYSLYLWHWPVIVLATYALDGKLPLVAQVSCIAGAIFLAGVTKHFLEDPLRKAYLPSGRRTTKPVVLLVAVGMLVPLAVLGGVVVSAQQAAATYRQVPENCQGASALTDPTCRPAAAGSSYPDPKVAFAEFKASHLFRACFPDVRRTGVVKCHSGAADAPLHIALVGDSHALMWAPALESAIAAGRVQMTTYLRASCPVNQASITKRHPQVDQLCNDWSDEVLAQVAATTTYDVVLTSAYTNKQFRNATGEASIAAAGQGFSAAWQHLTRGGATVIVIGEVPHPRVDPLGCLTTKPASACGRPRSHAVSEVTQWEGAPLLAAAANRTQSGQVHYLPVTDQICTADRCPAVIGGVTVYVDRSHLSAAYVRTLAPWFEAQITNRLT